MGYVVCMTRTNAQELGSIPLYLKEWRKHRGLSQGDVAKRVSDFMGREVARDRISKQENRVEGVSDTAMAAWAYALNVEPAELFGPPQPGASREALVRYLARHATDAELEAFKAIVASRIGR